MKFFILTYFLINLTCNESRRSKIVNWKRVFGPEKYIVEELNAFLQKSKESERIILPATSYVVKKNSIRMNVTLDGRTFLECGEGFAYLPKFAQAGPRKSRIVTLKRRKRSIVASSIYLHDLMYTLRKCEPIQRKIVHWQNEQASVRTLNGGSLVRRKIPKCPSSSNLFENFVRVDAKDNLVCSNEFPDPVNGDIEVNVPKLRIVVRFSLNNPLTGACVDSFSNVRVRQRHFNGKINKKWVYYLPEFDTLYKALESRLKAFFSHRIDKSKLCQTIDPKIRWLED